MCTSLRYTTTKTRRDFNILLNVAFEIAKGLPNPFPEKCKTASLTDCFSIENAETILHVMQYPDSFTGPPPSKTFQPLV